MGLLDDAIREHLELKRKHGADPQEVAQQEREALGSPRGAPAAAEPPAGREPAGAEPPAGQPAASEPEPLDPELALEHDAEPDLDWAESPARTPEPEPEPGPAEPRQRPFDSEDRVDTAEPRQRPFDSEDRVETAGQPTREYSVDELEELDRDEPESAADRGLRPPAAEPGREPPADVVPADEEPEGEDVLEETPEFLQETPEHDRLWFEQKPPRDFDF